MLRDPVMPPALNDARCKNCSLAEACVPGALVAGRQAYHLRRLYVADPDGGSASAPAGAAKEVSP
jgi:hypothetical protein